MDQAVQIRSAALCRASYRTCSAMAPSNFLFVACVFAAVPTLMLCSSASSSSSAEDGLDLEEAAVVRCVRIATPALIGGGTYEHLAKVDPCVNDGLNGVEDGKAPAAMARQILGCISGKPFPDDLNATVDDLKACITAALP